MMTTTDILDEKVIGTFLAALALYKVADSIGDRLGKGRAKEAVKQAGALTLILIMFGGLWVGYRLLPTVLPEITGAVPPPPPTPTPIPTPTPKQQDGRQQQQSPKHQGRPEQPAPNAPAPPYTEPAESPGNEQTSKQPLPAAPSPTPTAIPQPTCTQTQPGKTLFTPLNGKNMERQP